jgi:hypothetical protein
MLVLTDSLKDSYLYAGKKYPLNLAYDNVLRFYDLLDDTHFKSSEKVIIAFQMFFGFDPSIEDGDLIVKGFEDISHYISMKPYGNGDEDDDVEQGQLAVDQRKRYSFKQDAAAIYSSFMEQYGLDLINLQGKLHWDKFKALFQGLGPKTYFQRIIGIRTRDIKDLKGQELTDAMEAKEFYELDVNKTQEAKEQQIATFGQTIRAWAQS